MEEVIGEIIKIENYAQEIFQDAIDERTKKEQALQESLISLKSRIKKDAKKKVDQIRDREMEEVNQQIEAMNEACYIEIQKMMELDDEMHQQWVKQVVESVIEP